MFAKIRRAKLIGRKTYEIVSITIMKGTMANGHPFGNNIPNKYTPWCKNPIMLITVKAKIEIVKVTIN